MTDDEKRVLFHEKKAVIDTKQVEVDRLRKQYDTALQKALADLAPLMRQIRTLEAPLFDLKQELGNIARELRGPDGISRTALPEHNVNEGR